MNAWERVGTLSPSRGYQSGLFFNNRAFLIAGAENDGAVGLLNRVDASLDGKTMVTIDANPTGLTTRAYASEVVFDEKMWIVCGSDTAGNPLTDVLCSADGIKWTKVFDAPQGLIGHRIVAFGTPRIEIVVCGGMEAGGNYADIVVRGVNGVNYTSVTPAGEMWAGRALHGLLVYKGKLWLFGGVSRDGQGNNIFYNDVWWTDDLQHWHRAIEHAPWSARAAFGYCEWDERMWVIGGNTGVDPRTQQEALDHEVWFSRDGSTWKQAFDFPTGVAYTSAIVVENKIHVYGGYGNKDYIYKMNLG